MCGHHHLVSIAHDLWISGALCATTLVVPWCCALAAECPSALAQPRASTGVWNTTTPWKARTSCTTADSVTREVASQTPMYVSAIPHIHCFPILISCDLPQIQERNTGWPRKPDVLFRCDPAVIVVSLNWHLRATSFGKAVYQHLAMKYKDHEDRVRFYSNLFSRYTNRYHVGRYCLLRSSSTDRSIPLRKTPSPSAAWWPDRQRKGRTQAELLSPSQT